jgi:Raf kinase inhibitor-like YbhB/YbcL family protein
MSTMRVSSPAFSDGEPIPERFTCAGDDVSPALEWSGVPKKAVSLALLVEDLDASVRPATHWTAWGIDPAAAGPGEGERAPVEGRNDYGDTGYRGPCPPVRGDAHRYVFRLHALDAELDLEPGKSRRSFDAALEGHVLAEAELAGTFKRG